MGELAVAAVSALWLGILTSISPCPLATNIAAVSYLGRRVDRPWQVLGGGLLYSLGRTIAYVALGTLIVAGLLSMPKAARFLQQYMNQIIGPLLIITGLFLLEVLRFRLPGLGRASERLQQRFTRLGMVGAVPLGALFALSFCPVSAALFFGSLMALALRLESPVLLPTMFGIGTALPVVLFALLVAAGARFIGKLFDRLTVIERWARRVTGIVFIVVGLYMTLIYSFGLFT